MVVGGKNFSHHQQKFTGHWKMKTIFIRRTQKGWYETDLKVHSELIKVYWNVKSVNIREFSTSTLNSLSCYFSRVKLTSIVEEERFASSFLLLFDFNIVAKLVVMVEWGLIVNSAFSFQLHTIFLISSQPLSTWSWSDLGKTLKFFR